MSNLDDSVFEYSTATKPESFPCLVCGKTLYRAFEPFEQQPDDGIMCETGGNYGSTAFDSMNGEKLAFNICDDCIVAAAGQGRVMTYRKFRLITVDIGPLHSMVVGHEDLDRPYVRWHPRIMDTDESIQMEIEELEHLPKHCHLDVPLDRIKAMAVSNYWDTPGPPISNWSPDPGEM